MITHPTSEELCRHVDGTLDPRRRDRLDRHLRDCAACRGERHALRDLDVQLRSLPRPPAPARVLERILASRAAADRTVVLPEDARRRRPTSARRSSRWRQVAAAALLAVAGGTAVLMQSSELAGYSSELRLHPERPMAGAEISVEYSPAFELRDESVLRLRARYRTATGEPYNWRPWHVDAARLVRGADGRYRGHFTLPDSVVFAVFAVEDTNARAVDSNRRRGWELLVHSAAALPTPAALRQRVHDRLGSSWDEAYATARTMTELYPDSPESWGQRFWFERQLPAMASDEALKRLQLERFHARFSDRTDVSAADAEALFYLFRGQDDSVRAEFWGNRLLAAAPASHGALHIRTDAIAHRVAERDISVAQAFEELDVLYNEAPHGQAALSLARVLLDLQPAPDLARRWVDRIAAQNPAEDGAETLLRFPPLRDEGMRRLRERIDALQTSTHDRRDLFMNADDDRRERLQPGLASAYATLGRSLLADGDTAGAVAALIQAGDGNWDTRRYRRVATDLEAAGETDRAAELWARVAADPSTSAAFADTVFSRIGGRTLEWSAQLEAGRAEMRRQTARSATNRALPRGIRLADRSGAAIHLHDLSGDRPVVVVMWSRFCGPALAALPFLTALEGQLAAAGARLITVSTEPGSVGFDEFAARQETMPAMWHDHLGEARRALGSFGTPQYFVLDRDGRLRFEFSAAGDILRQVAFLDDEAAVAP